MTARSLPPDLPATPASYSGAGFVYVAACSGPEDILKVGLTHDPIARWSAFHRRWFEAFDLDQSLLIQTETRRDAQGLETALHRLLREHNCPLPMTMRDQYGGVTEWYRGAHAAVLGFAMAAAEQGHVLHLPARRWFEPAVRARTDVLVGLLDQARRDIADGVISPAQCDALHDLVDMHRAFDDAIDTRFSFELKTLDLFREP